MATYNEQMQQLTNRYMLETGRTEASARDIAAWAGAAPSRRWRPLRKDT
jgi:hypothetical protein